MGPPLADTSSVTRDAFEIAYAAHTAVCTFLLDEAGICRRVVMASAKRPHEGKSLARCMGAQYVASLDGRTPGGLVELPRVGASMLFARVDDRGRISLVRTGLVTKFESRKPSSRKKNHDPFAETDGVRTSAPDISATTTPRGTRVPDPTPTFGEEHTPVTLRGSEADQVYFDITDRTQRIPTMRRSDPDLASSRETRGSQPPPPPASVAALEEIDIDVDDLATQEYPSAPPPAPLEGQRTTLPSSLAPPQLPTLRRPRFDSQPPSSDEVDAYGAKARGARRRSEGALRAAQTARATQPLDLPDAPRSDLKLARRRS